MKHEQLTGKIIEVFYEVYNELGHGFLESVYENAMRLALTEAGFFVPPKKELNVWFRGVIVGTFEPDITVENLVILELKSARAIDPAHEAQLLNYLRATEVEVGLLFNFGPKPDFKRMVFDNERKKVKSTDKHGSGHKLNYDQAHRPKQKNDEQPPREIQLTRQLFFRPTNQLPASLP
jgi:GxxExxY protein